MKKQNYEKSASAAIAEIMMKVFKGKCKTIHVNMRPYEDVFKFIQKVEDAHKKAAKSNLRFGSAYPEDKLLNHLTEIYGKQPSTTITLRKCNDLNNFLEEKARQEAISRETKMYFKQAPIYA